MLWAPCVHVDLPVDAPDDQAKVLGEALDTVLFALSDTVTAGISLSLSAAALDRFARLGLERTIEKVAVLADAQRIELVSTAAHGALLPLLPPVEIERQIELNDTANRRWFADLYRPKTLWPPALAVSPGVVEVARDLGYTSLLVDELALGAHTNRWAGDRIDAVAGKAGFFLLPCSRIASEKFGAGLLRERSDVSRHLPPEAPLDAYLITAVELQPDARLALSLSGSASRERLARLSDLFKETRLDQSTPLLPCSNRSTLEEIERGLPFQAWFDPANEPQHLRWWHMLELFMIWQRAETAGLGATPEAQLLRRHLDLGWRESNWRGAVEDFLPKSGLREAVQRLQQFAPAETGLPV